MIEKDSLILRLVEYTDDYTLIYTPLKGAQYAESFTHKKAVIGKLEILSKKYESIVIHNDLISITNEEIVNINSNIKIIVQNPCKSLCEL